jgi:hypothetical protein
VRHLGVAGIPNTPSAASVGLSAFSATGTPSSSTYLRGDNSWASVGAVNDVFYLNSNTITANYTSPANYNLMSAGPITINTGVTVTIDTTGNWVIV